MPVEYDFFEVPDFRIILRRQFETRKSRRSSYTMRAFARDIGLTSTRLSAIFKGTHGLSGAAARVIGKKLNFNDLQTEFFADLSDSQHARSQVERAAAKARLRQYQKFAEYRAGNEDLYNHWRAPAILELINIRKGKVSPDEIAQLLRLSKEEVEHSLRILLNAGEIEKTADGFLSSDRFMVVDRQVPTEAVRQFHERFLDRAKDAVRTQPISKRKHLNAVFSFDSTRTEQARDWIAKMHKKFMDEFGTEKNPDSVCGIGMSFFRFDEETKK